MALTSTDRRRILLASALTVVAMPALWWANQSSAPNVATAGIAVVDKSATTASTDTGDSRDSGDVAPVFLDGPSGQVGAGLAEIAVPAPPAIASITTTATFRSTLGSPSACMVPGIASGQQVVVVNLDNNRSVTCTAILAPSSAADQLVMASELFAELADLTDAPIPVEIRQ